MAMCRLNGFHFDLRVRTELQVLSKTVSCLWFYAYKKYRNGNSARHTSTQCHIRLPVSYSGSDNFSSHTCTCHIFLGPFWDLLVYFLGQMTFFWDKYCKIPGHFQDIFPIAKSVNELKNNSFFLFIILAFYKIIIYFFFTWTSA